MFNSAILDVAIGLILIYVIMALGCTAANEYIAQLLGLRAEMLWRAVKGLFQNVQGGDAFTKLLYDHDLIDALSPNVTGAKPSFIPSHIFSLALIDLLGFHQQQLSISGASVVSVLESVASAPDKPVDQTGLVVPAHPDIDPKTISDLVKTLRPLAAAAGNDVDLFRKNIETWFDAGMDRASSWYTARLRTITLMVAFAACLVSNADTFMLADSLWASPTVRTELTEAAKSISQNKDGAVQLKGNPTIQKAQAQATMLLGWSGSIFDEKSGNSNDPHRFPHGTDWISKLAGIVISTMAVSLGAPFWFNILGQLLKLKDGGSPDSASSTGPSEKRISSQGSSA